MNVPSSVFDNRRNRLAVRLANAALRIATPRYRYFVEGAIKYGMDAAANDAKTGRPHPPDWRTWRK